MALSDDHDFFEKEKARLVGEISSVSLVKFLGRKIVKNYQNSVHPPLEF